MTRRAVRIMRAARHRRDVGAAAQAWIGEVGAAQRVKRGGVVGRVRALAAIGRLESQAEPREILDDRSFVFGLAAACVQVFNAQQQPAVEVLGAALIAQGGIGMPQVKPPVGRRRKTKDGAGGHQSISKAKSRPSKHARPAAKSAHAPGSVATVGVIDGRAALDRATDALLGAGCPIVAKLVAIGGRPPLRLRAPGFSGFAAIVVSQQVSVASANAIFARLQSTFAPLDGAAIRAADDESLKSCGLSRAKIRTLRALADAERAGLDLPSLGGADATQARRRLAAIWGVGPWTADIFLLFCLGHPDAFPAGDLALQEAARMAIGLRKRPDAARLEAIAARWRPYRGVAARMLWAFYRATKRGAGMVLTQATE